MNSPCTALTSLCLTLSLFLAVPGVSWSFDLSELKQRAEQGIARAQYNLGVKYEEGHDVVKNVKKAARWYHHAAEQGQAQAQIALAFLHARGQGVTQDHVTAHMWANLAASNAETDPVKVIAQKWRDQLANGMTHAQIALAHKRAWECVGKNYKGC